MKRWWWSEGKSEGARQAVYIGRENMRVFVCTLVCKPPSIRRVANSRNSNLERSGKIYEGEEKPIGEGKGGVSTSLL